MKSGSPSRTTAAHKTQTKIQAWSSLSSTVVTPHLTLPKLLRGTRDRWVVQVLFITNYSTGLAPFPRLSAPPHSSHTPIAPRRPGGTPETALYSPPLGGGRQGGRGVPGGKDRRGERKGDGRMRSDREARGEREKKKKSRSGSRTHCRSVLNQLSGSLAVPCDGTGPLWWTARCSSASWRTAMASPSRAAGSESPVPCSSTNLADGSRLRPTGERRRLLRSLSDGSHPSSSQEHGSEPSVPPALPLLQHHRFGQPLAISASSCCPISLAPRSPSAVRALWQRVPPSSRVSAPM